MKMYHYTSAKNWERIKNDGLKLQHINRDALSAYFPDGVMGIYLWEEDLTGIAHLGALMFQLYSKGDTKIVKLEIISQDILLYDNRRVVLNHQGDMGAFTYQQDEPCLIAIKPIPAKDIKFIKEYDLIELLK